MSRLLVLALVVCAVLVPAALAKEGAQAQLLSSLPLHAQPGKVIRVAWTVDVPDESGKRVPFNAIGMFVELAGKGGARTTATAAESYQVDGRFTARVRVPRGGIRHIRFGLHGTTDIYFALRKS